MTERAMLLVHKFDKVRERCPDLNVSLINLGRYNLVVGAVDDIAELQMRADNPKTHFVDRPAYAALTEYRRAYQRAIDDHQAGKFMNVVGFSLNETNKFALGLAARVGLALALEEQGFLPADWTD